VFRILSAINLQSLNYDLISLSCVTAGFGNAPPATAGGKVFCVFFILCGVPLFALTALGVGELLSIWANAARNAFYRCILKREAPHKKTLHATVCNTASLFVFGFVLLIIIPAAIFYSLETSWTYGDALYGALMVTLTIGFTDFLPGEELHKSNVPFRSCF
jgi:hypothetical protein